MSEKSEAGSAGRRSPASGLSFAGASDLPELALLTTEIQSRRVATRFGLPASTASTIAALAFGSIPETWRASR